MRLAILGNGKVITVDELSDIFMKQQEARAHNINLVSPTIYADKIAQAIHLAQRKGLCIPIIYNSNGYENVDILRMLDGLIDVYLPDLKYGYNELGVKYSGVKNYFEIATNAILEMERQVGAPRFDENGIIKSGLIIRHLVLPNHLENTKKILKWYRDYVKKDVYISVMTQYFPTYRAEEFEEIHRKITKEEYDEIEGYIYDIGIENGYMQDFCDEDETQYVPKWDIDN